jgi:hypothetical protein
MFLVVGLLTLSVPARAEKASPVTVTAGLGQGVQFHTQDGRFSLRLRARIQARFTTLTARENPETGEVTGPASQEFMIRRQRLVLSGHAWSKALKYYVQYGFSNLDTEGDLRLPLRDAYLTWELARDASVMFGQGKVPFNRQRVISSGSLMFVDRSLANAELNLDRDVGVQLLSRDFLGREGRLGYHLGVFGGDGRNRLSERQGMLYVARVEARFFRDFDDYRESDWGRSRRPRLAVGAAAAYNSNTVRELSTIGATRRTPVDYRHMVVDAMFKLRGFSLQSELLFRGAPSGQVIQEFIDPATGQRALEVARNAWGWFVQAGYLLTEHLEIAGRTGEVRPHGASSRSQGRQAEYGGALGYYWQEHALKLQADYLYLSTEQLFEASSGEERRAMTGRHQARVQFQLHF